ncbi:3-keto-5-aminohexanoate cleavage enzyme [bacterium HR39]|nr:3-keto-5-aminohexanoate cleavage enzyme [bacterium HR39]
MSDPFAAPAVLMVAPNGARRTGADHPRLPVTLEAVLAEAEAAADAGAVALHVHVRDESGRHSLDPELNRRWYEALRGRVGHRLVLQLTTEAAGIHGAEAQMRVVEEVRPEAVSLALREFAPEGEPSADVRRFLERLAARSVSPQYILYTPEEVARFRELRENGVIPQRRPFVLFVLGRHTAPGEPVDPAQVDAFLARHDPACPFMVCAFERRESACLVHAAVHGGHLRVGFENSLVHGDGRPAACNAERIEDVRTILRRIGRPLADLAAARAIFGEAARV